MTSNRTIEVRVLRLLLCSLLLSSMAARPHDVVGALSAPQKPEDFNDIDELSRYLEELKQYYTIIGRPRFGRSVDSQQRRLIDDSLATRLTKQTSDEIR